MFTKVHCDCSRCNLVFTCEYVSLLWVFCGRKGQRNASCLIPICIKVDIMSLWEVCPQMGLSMPTIWRVVLVKNGNLCPKTSQIPYLVKTWAKGELSTFVNLNIPCFCFCFLQEHKLQTCQRSPAPTWYKNPKFITVLRIFPSWNFGGCLESHYISNNGNFLHI